MFRGRTIVLPNRRRDVPAPGERFRCWSSVDSPLGLSEHAEVYSLPELDVTQ